MHTDLTSIDADTVAAIIRNAEKPNTIEIGFTPSPIHTMLADNLIENRTSVLAAIADRFPVYCTTVTRITDRHYRHHFAVANATRDGWPNGITCDVSQHGFEISTGAISLTDPNAAIAFAKAINAITEWARNAA